MEELKRKELEREKAEGYAEAPEGLEANKEQGGMIARIRDKLVQERQRLAQQRAAISLVIRKGSVGRALRFLSSEDRRTNRRKRRRKCRFAEGRQDELDRQRNAGRRRHRTARKRLRRMARESRRANRA